MRRFSLLLLLIFSNSVFADGGIENAGYEKIIPYYYNNMASMLLSPQGDILYEKADADFKFEEGLWISYPLHHPTSYENRNSNIRHAKTYPYAFKILDLSFGKLLDSLVPKKDLKYLGNNRIAFRYKDSGDMIIIDDEAKLISPENTYYSAVLPYKDGKSRVTTPYHLYRTIDINAQVIPYTKVENEANLEKEIKDKIRTLKRDYAEVFYKKIGEQGLFYTLRHPTENEIKQYPESDFYDQYDLRHIDLLTIYDKNLNLLFKEKIIGKEQMKSCKLPIIALKNKDDKTIYPKDVAQACKDAKLFNILLSSKYSYTVYPRDEELAPANRILKDVGFLYQNPSLNVPENARYSLGPKKIEIDGRVILQIPEGYEYISFYEDDEDFLGDFMKMSYADSNGRSSALPTKDCHRVLHRLFSKNEIYCIGIYQTGYIDIETRFNKAIADLKSIDSLQDMTRGFENKKWNIYPRLDKKNHSLEFSLSYRDLLGKEADSEGHKGIYGDKYQYLKFADQFLVMVENRDTQGAFKKGEGLDFNKLISIKPGYQYRKHNEYFCSQINGSDTLLEYGKNYRYISTKHYCQPYDIAYHHFNINYLKTSLDEFIKSNILFTERFEAISAQEIYEEY